MDGLYEFSARQFNELFWSETTADEWCSKFVHVPDDVFIEAARTVKDASLNGQVAREANPLKLVAGEVKRSAWGVRRWNLAQDGENVDGLNVAGREAFLLGFNPDTADDRERSRFFKGPAG